MRPVILNSCSTIGGGAAELFDAARTVKFEGRDSEAARRLPGLAASLRAPPASDRKAALAFWIQVYNALVIHGALHFGVQKSVKEVPGFFRRAAYRIEPLDGGAGGLLFTPDDIEHGILRANRGHPRRLLLPQFAPWDRRRRLVVRPMDRRVHFALNCGAASCPPIRHYEAGKLDEQLDLAAQAFVNGGGVVVAEDGALLLSPLLRWFWRDFGLTGQARVQAVLPHVDPERRQAILQAARKGIRYIAYDWHFA